VRAMSLISMKRLTIALLSMASGRDANGAGSSTQDSSKSG
jgi:hypothetical protein